MALVLALCILAVGEYHLVRHWFRVHTNPRRHHNVKMCPQAISITLFPFAHDCMLLDDNRITLVTPWVLAYHRTSLTGVFG